MKRILFAAFWCLFVGTTILSAAEQTDVPSSKIVWLGFPMPEWTPNIASINLRENKSFGSAFLKQLRRQAVLIAARDGLGVSTRDAFLSETAPQGAVQISEPDRFLVEQTGQNFFAQDVDYPSYVAELEKLSRTEFVAALEKIGVTKSSPLENQETVDFEEIEKLLADYALIPHVEAVRELHAAIRKQGETLTLLSALVRGYTQLQILTNSSVRDTHRVFQARAILYAQRAVAKFGENPETLGLRAAAWSLNNFHRIAREEFAKVPVSENEIVWVRLARRYADFDVDGLDKEIESLKDQPEQRLGKLLKFCLLTYSGNRVPLTVSYGQTIIADLPDCSRIYQNLFSDKQHQLPVSPDGKPYIEHLARRLGPQLRKLKNEPQAVAKAAKDLRELFSSGNSGGLLPGFFGGGQRELSNIRPGDFCTFMSEILKAMNEASPDQDHDEPSLQTLATLLQDETFYSVLLLVPRGDGPDATILPARSVLDTHPMMNQLGLACRDEKVKTEFKERLERNRVPYELISQLNFGFGIPGRDVWSKGDYITPYIMACRFADPENVRDQVFYHQEVRWHLGKDVPVFSVDVLEKLCPDNPFTVAEKIARQWTYNDEEADALCKRFEKYPNFREAIIGRFLLNDRREKAITLLRQDLKAIPERDLAVRTAKVCLEQGDFDEAVEVLKEYVGATKEGWYRAETNRNIGQILCAAGKLKEAEPFLDAALENDSSQARAERARWLELSGRFDAAEAAYRDIRDLYYLRWWAACFRMNNDNLDAAIDFTFDKIMEARKKSSKGNFSGFIYLYYVFYCSDIPMQEEFGDDPSVKVFFEYNTASAGFLAFFEALEKKDDVKAGTLLKLLQEKGPLVDKADFVRTVRNAGLAPGQKNPKIEKTAYRLLAGMFELDRRSPEPGSLNPRAVEELLRISYKNALEPAEFPELLYLLGRYYSFYGQREKALDCYRRLFAVRNLNETCDESFAVRELQKMGLGQKDFLAWVSTDPGLPKRPASKSDIELFTRQLTAALNSTDPAADGGPVVQLRTGDLPVTDLFADGRMGTLSPAELVQKFIGRKGNCFYTAFSPDGKKVATAGEDHFVVLWDAETGRQLAVLDRSKTTRGSAVAFSRDGNSIFFGGTGGEVGCWVPKLSEDEQKPTWIQREHGWTGRVAVSPDGTLLCSTMEDGGKPGAMIWDATAGQPIHTLRDHKKAVYDARFFDKGNRLVTVSGDGTAIVYDTKNWRPIWCLQGHAEGIRGLSVSPDDKIIATGSDDDTVYLWDAKTGKPIKHLGMFNGDVISLAFSPDGSKLAVGKNWNGEGTFILETKNWTPIYYLPGHGWWNCQPSWSSDGRLLTGGNDARLWKFLDADEIETALPDAFKDAKELSLKELPPKPWSISGANAVKFETLRSNRKEFEDSLSAHAPSRLVYRLGKHWTTFKTSYGILTSAQLSQASCLFVVLGDGEELFRSEIVRDSLDRPLELDVRNVDKLELIIDPNGNNFNDHGAWLSPTLSR